MTLNSRIREDRFRTAVAKLSKYYGLRTPEQDMIGIINRVRSSTVGPNGTTAAPSTGTSATTSDVIDPIDRLVSDLLNDIFNSTIGAYKVEDIARRIINATTSTTTTTGGTAPSQNELETTFGKLIQIIGDGENVRNIRRLFPPIYQKLQYVGIRGTETAGTPAAASIPILDLTSGESPPDAGGTRLPDGGALVSNCAIIMLNSPNLNISNRHTKAVSMFLNGVPPLEFAKAVPYMEINFEFPTPAIEEESNRLLAPSVYKLILGGAVAPEGSVLNTLQTANSSSNLPSDPAGPRPPRNYTSMGMEVFTSPQIIFNQRTQPNSETRNNNILDPTRPILSIKQLTTSEVPSFSTYSYRTAQLQMTLHDRSRMPDLAAFFRADLRGNTRVDIEYGWIHPDGEKLTPYPNMSPYPDLINGMRRREKFQIRNSSFQFNESGKVDITLELVTLGQSQMSSEMIISDGDTASQAIQRLNQLQEQLSELVGRTSLRSESDPDRPTVRLTGQQVLEPASDAFTTGFELDNEQRTQYRSLIRELTSASLRNTEIFSRIARNLQNIWGSRGDGAGGAVANVRTSLQTDVRRTLDDIIKFYNGRPPASTGTARRRTAPTSGWPNDLGVSDPLVIRTNPQRLTTSGNEGLPGLLGAGTSFTSETVPNWLRGDTNYSNYSVSLATIMANFVAKPLMRTGTYEEIQFIFYPFNENAGFANRINIANFEVNLGMFAERLVNYRLNNASRSGNFTLTEFWSFITTNIINNNAASSYGLWQANMALYTRPSARERNSSSASSTNPWTTRTATNETSYNYLLSELLSNGHVTPTGEFRPPQLRMFTECLPIRNDDASTTEGRATGNILRIHIYDQQMSSVVGLSEILMAERNRALSLDGRPRNPEDNAVTLWAQYRARLIQQAVDAGIIRNIGGANATEQRYVIVGGSNRIKEFVMNNSAHLTPGTQHSLIKGVSLSSIQDEAASTLNLVNSPRPSELVAPNGEEPSGLPLQVIPVEMSMTTIGCPLIGFSGQYFIDLKTGTTADDLYAVNRIDSTLEPGSYRTTIKLRPISGYTRYRNYLNEIRNTVHQLHDLTDGSDTAVNEAARSATESAARPSSES